MANIKWYTCSACGASYRALRKTCSECGEVNTIVYDEEKSEGGSSSKSGKLKNYSPKSKPLMEFSATDDIRISSSIGEFDRVLGGGAVHDSVMALSAPPGTGKSTLLLQVSNGFAKNGKKVLFVSGEESEKQIFTRAKRILPYISENLYLMSTNSMDELVEEAKQKGFDVVICDSISKMSTMTCPGSRPGTPVQMETCTDMLINLCKFSNKPRIGIMIVHVTKDDEMRGTRTVEHDVDVTLKLEGEDYDDLRILRTLKNRFGELDTGLFLMTKKGLEELSNPSDYFVTQRGERSVNGVALSVVNEGTRPIVVEIESLLASTSTPYPSRTATCLRKDNLNILLSIMNNFLGYKMDSYNVVINTTGGLKVSEPAINLAIIMSIASNYLKISSGKTLDISKYVYLAEVGLTGELKRVQGLDRRLKELERLGYKHAFVAKGAVRDKSEFKNLQIIECDTIASVLNKTIALKER